MNGTKQDGRIDAMLTSSEEEQATIDEFYQETRRDVGPHPWELGNPRYIQSMGGDIRVIEFPGNGTLRRPVVFVPGWGTTPFGFTTTFEVLSEAPHWCYVETREKGTSHIDPKRIPMGMDAMAEDVAAAIQTLGADDFVLIGTCWGSATILHGLSRGIIKAPTVVVSDPMKHLWAPAWVRHLLIPLAPIRLTDALRNPIARISLRNMPEGPQRKRALDFIQNADVAKWKKAAAQCRAFDLFRDLPVIEQEIFVTNGASDVIHVNHDYPRIAADLPRGRFLYIRTDEANPERLLGVLSLQFAGVTADQGLPESLKLFERDVTPLRA